MFIFGPSPSTIEKHIWPQPHRHQRHHGKAAIGEFGSQLGLLHLGVLEVPNIGPTAEGCDHVEGPTPRDSLIRPQGSVDEELWGFNEVEEILDVRMILLNKVFPCKHSTPTE